MYEGRLHACYQGTVTAVTGCLLVLGGVATLPGHVIGAVVQSALHIDHLELDPESFLGY